MIPVAVSKALTTADDDNICLSQTPLAAGNLTIAGAAATGGVATLDTQRNVIITFAGADAGRTLTVYGTREGGQSVVEAIAGANTGIVVLLNDFLTVTRVAVDAATAGAVKVGTNTTGSTPWKNASWHIAPFSLALEMNVSGTVTYSLQYTMDDFYTAGGWAGAAPSQPRVRATTVAGAAGNASYTFQSPIRGWRLTVTAGTGTVLGEAIQAGIGSAAA